ncbi:MAG: TonB-dependent receptor [Oceanicaulis sp.]
MTSALLLSAAALALSTGATAAEADQSQARPAPSPGWVDVITVTGRPMDTGASKLPALDAPAAAPDAAGLVARLPGAALIDNGALSGQVQYRGLFGPRIAVAIDGQRFASGGPNLMDPPLHYAPAPLLERIELTRGPAPVSAGPAISAQANAVFKSIPYAQGAAPEVSADLTAIARSVDDSLAAGGVAGIATARQRLQILASFETGGDLQTPKGVLDGTEHERAVYGIGYAVRPTDALQLTLDWRRQETGLTGNPPFPMDIRFFDTDTTRAGLDYDAGDWRFDAGIAHARVDHAMNNFTLRPAPMMMRLRETFAGAETWSANAGAARDLAGGEVRFGVDTEQSEHDVTVTNPANPAFFVTPAPDIEIARTGAFAEWEGPAAGAELYLGARLDAHEAEAGAPRIGPALPMGPRRLANAYTASDRSGDAVTVDLMARARVPISDTVSWRGSIARKSRAPNYLERFAWLPTPASGGLADGNTYVGDLDLDAETATSLEAGFDVAGPRAYLRPSVHVSWIADYIQGAPAEPLTPGVVDTPLEMVSAMNGDPTPLRFSNVEARIYGLDADFGAALTGAWWVDGVFSLARGERTDIDDDLYRIAPARLRTGLTYEAAGWSATLETVAVAEQARVSQENSEAETPGYVLVNLFADLALSDTVLVSAGVENLLDQPWRDHLGGYNRNSGLGVPVGERLPGPGAGAWVRLNARF